MGGPHNFITEISLTLIGVLMGIEAVVLLRMGKKTLLHFVAAAFCAVMGAFIALFGFSLVSMSVETYTALSRVSEMMSVIVIPLFLHGILLLSRKGPSRRSGFWQALIYLPALILLACSAREPLLAKSFYLDGSGVWNGVNRTEGWPTLLFWVYAIGCLVAGLCLLFLRWFRARDRAVRKLSLRLNLATLLTLAAFCTSMVGNLAYLYRNSPWLDYLLNLFFVLSFYVWILAYRKAIVGMTEGASVPPVPLPPVRGLLLPGEEISSREYEVLALLAEGLDVDGIGQRLFIAPSTVKSHIHHLYQKTGARNRVDLIKLIDGR
jgi:DNA-binding CsgD family transcriptional regulator